MRKWIMAIGILSNQVSFYDPLILIGDRLEKDSIYYFLAEHGGALFPDDYFSDLYSDSKRGRPTIPARVLATVMLLQSFNGFSDREALDSLKFDLRWQAACGVSIVNAQFHPTVLVGLRNRLRGSDRPRRLFEDSVQLAKKSGVLKSNTRVLDSSCLYDAVSTQDCVTQLRAAIRKVISTSTIENQKLIRSVLRRDDKYDTPGKPPCDWDDKEARETLIDELIRDAQYVLEVLDQKELDDRAREAAELLALVVGQDVEHNDENNKFEIVKKVAKDRIISVVDPQARHGHKSKNRRFDGYKAHISVEPGSEIICESAITPANQHDHNAVSELTGELILSDSLYETNDNTDLIDPNTKCVIGDAAYGDGATREELLSKDIEVVAKLAPVRNATGLFTKDKFQIDLNRNTVTCPVGNSVQIRRRSLNASVASFRKFYPTCPIRQQCTKSKRGRTISINRYEHTLQEAREFQKSEYFSTVYKSIRPIVERKIAHIMQKKWGGRYARCIGLERIKTDLLTRCAVINLKRLAVLGLRYENYHWRIA